MARTTLGRVDLFDASGRGHGDDGGQCTYKAVSFDLELVTGACPTHVPTPVSLFHHNDDV